MHKPPYRIKNMVPGMIMLWHGAVGNIPSGWHLCDGTVGTPDLRNRFIVCAGDEYNPGDNQGNPTHTHDFTTDGHMHSLMTGTYFSVTPAEYRHFNTNVKTDTGTTDPVLAKPPYYALCYIMKL